MYTVRDLMSNRVLYVTPGATVQAAMDLLRLQQLGLLPVVDQERVDISVVPHAIAMHPRVDQGQRQNEH